MPIPVPQRDETKDDFISRCVSLLADETQDDGSQRGPDNNQRLAICFGSGEEINESVVNRINTYLDEATVAGGIAGYPVPIGYKRRKDRFVLEDDDSVQITQDDDEWVLWIDGVEIVRDKDLSVIQKKVKKRKG